MRPRHALNMLVLAGLVAGSATAQEVETSTVDGTTVRLHVHEFLTEEELQVLRLVATNADARTVFVTDGGGFAAMAVSPREGFVRKGELVPSATAVGGAVDAEAAATQALETCNTARKKGPDCVLVLEVAPE